MTPTITGSISSRETLLTNKLRKPMVEKIRRERINSSIEKLKTLLAQEFVKQQPDSRQEKADILEMTLDFLRRSQKSSAAGDGHSRCVQEAVSFLSQCPVQTQSHTRLMKLFLHMQTPADKHTRLDNPQTTETRANSSAKQHTPARSHIWRPW
nr:Her4.2 protein [Danio rerio]AAI64898.1 Her4.2 protein [Danio rerio]